MRTLHVVPSLAARTGGPAFNVAALTSGLARAGEPTAVLTTDLSRPVSADKQRRFEFRDLVDVDPHVDVRIFPSRPPRRIAYAPGLGRHARDAAESVDLVHIHSLFLYPQAVAARAARRADVPYVVSPRGSLDPWVRRQGRFQKRVATVAWQSRLLSGAAALHVASPGEASYISDVAPTVPRLVIPNGIHTREFSNTPRADARAFRNQLRIAEDAVVVLYLGRISKKKNLQALIEAFAASKTQRSRAILVLAGPDDERLTPRIRTAIRSFGIDNTTRLIGELRGAKKRAAYAASDIFVLPSHTENFGVAAIEAMASGCAVVMSDAVAIARDLQRESAVAVVEPNARDLSGVLWELITQGELRTAYGTRARDAARAYDWENLVPRYLSAYEAVVGSAGR